MTSAHAGRIRFANARRARSEYLIILLVTAIPEAMNCDKKTLARPGRDFLRSCVRWARANYVRAPAHAEDFDGRDRFGHATARRVTPSSPEHYATRKDNGPPTPCRPTPLARRRALPCLEARAEWPRAGRPLRARAHLWHPRRCRRSNALGFPARRPPAARA